MINREDAERIFGRMTPQEIADYIMLRETQLRHEARQAPLPIWVIIYMLVTGAYLVLSALAGEPSAIWIFRVGAVAWLLGWVWVAIVVIRDRRRASGPHRQR